MPVTAQLDLWREDRAQDPANTGHRSEAETPSQRGGWSREVALDPRHRPQAPDRPASTVRRDWWRAPQEAHLLDETNHRYRKLLWHEMAILQGFDPDWFDAPALTKSARIGAIGDAVPPPLAHALLDAVSANWHWRQPTAVEICAGAGGLASGAARHLAHLALVDNWDVACEILRHCKPWPPDAVLERDATSQDWTQLRGRVGLLSGGPPCQPWSQAGRRRGAIDHRDLLGRMDEIVSAIEPEVFVFENVPGLISVANGAYFRAILGRLRRPTPNLQYGVMAGVLNAADFGVPQVRRRLFLIGFRDEPLALAHRVLDEAYGRRTHRAPVVADSTRPTWRTVGDALRDRPDPGGWRPWVAEREATPANAA